MGKLNPRLIALLVIFVALLGYTLYDRGVFTGGSDGGESSVFSLGGGSQSPLASSAAASNLRSGGPMREINWASGWKNDPFFYAEAETTEAGGISLIGDLLGGAETPKLKLGGISWRGNIGMVLINGTVLEEGDRISGYQVTTIAYDYVILRKGTNILRISLDD